MSQRSQRRLHERLATTHRVISLDLPGFGGMPKPGRDVTIAQMADALAELLSALGLSRSILVGHSMGAQWVTEVATRHPEAAAAVVLVGPVVDNEHPRAYQQTVALLLDGLREPLPVKARVTLDYARCGPPWFLAQVGHMLRYSTIDRIAALSVPVLIVRGTRDPVAGPEWCERLAEVAAEGRAVEVPGVPHHAQLIEPETVARELRAFADSLAGAPR
jgi:pimeloyl-ACP methyl ester carboxylesterase